MNPGYFRLIFLGLLLQGWLLSLTAQEQMEVGTQPQPAAAEAPAQAAPSETVVLAPAEGQVEVGMQPQGEVVAVQGNAALAQVEAEQLQRVETGLKLGTALEEAAKLEKAGEYERARARLESITQQVEPTGAFGDYYFQAYRQMGRITAAQANLAEQNGDYVAARKLWEQAATYEPENEAYRERWESARRRSPTPSEKYPHNQAVDQELIDQVAKIQTLMFEGDNYYHTGQHARALGKYREVLLMDPYNKLARQRIERVERSKEVAMDLRRDAERLRALKDVENAWATEIRPRAQAQQPTVTDRGAVSNINRMFDKLENIRIPELKFTEVEVKDALQYIRDQTVALDPEKVGINFVVKTETTQAPPAPVGTEGNATVAEPPRVPPVTMDVRDMPVIKVLDIISTFTNLQYKVEEFAVYVFPSNEVSDVLLVRTFSVPPTFFRTRVTTSTDTTALGGGKVSFSDPAIVDELKEKGVEFPSGATAAYLPKTAKLVVRNTADNLNLLDQLLQREQVETRQIDIETKFVEFSDDKLKDFSFNWRVHGDTNLPPDFVADFIPPINADVDGDGFPDFAPNSRVGFGSALRNSGDLQGIPLDTLLNRNVARTPANFSVSAIINETGVRMLLTALESALGADLMSAPRVTVVSGQSTKIRTVRELFYPTSYEPPELRDAPTGGGGGGGGNTVKLPASVIPSNPEDFVSRDIGVTLEVKANANPDRRIDLELKPEVVEFQGFINYAGNITYEQEGDVFVSSNGVAFQPVFSLRTVETKVQVVDGQTVVLGGFIREDFENVEDKVPLLGDLPLIGRAFRSKGERAVKRNLIIFLTARMVNPDGTPKFLTPTEAEEFGVSAAPAAEKPKS
jgi:general secretion pathway protein D